MTPKSVISAYARRISRGTITIDDVPESCRKEVEQALSDSSN